jgi:DNA-binding NarL/FixJ family response regulator
MNDPVEDRAIRVLVADDRPAFHRELAESLAFDRRLEVVGHAHDEEETLDLLAAFEPEIVVLNVSSPELGGSHAVSRIHACRPATRILAVFDSSSTDAIFTLAGVRAAGYVAADDLPPAVARAVVRLAGV